MQRNRLLLLAAALGVAAVVAVVLIVVGSTGGSKASTTTTTSDNPAPAASPFAGVPQHGDTLGTAGAPVTLIVFEDPQCPFCRDWNVNTLPIVIADFVKPGRIKVVFRGINIVGPNSELGLRAIYAAAAQNKLWNTVEGLYARQGSENSGWITEAVIRAVAKDAKASADAILAAVSSASVTAQVRAAAQEAIADGVRGTPTFVLQRPLAQPQQLQAPLDPSGFTAALTSALP